MKKKTTLKDHIQAWAGAIGIVGGLFAFCIICGVLFMDYDPMTMIDAIREEWQEITSVFR